MEILALLLLGLIAMLAIVPPIIRGKLEESPLASTQSFQRSMQEMANSIESGSSREDAQYRSRGPHGYVEPVEAGLPGRPRPVPTRNSRKNRAALRRSRIIAALTVFAAIWGVAALVSGKTWCLVIFVVACCLLAVFWGMALVIPNIKPRPGIVHHPEEVSRYPRSQAL